MMLLLVLLLVLRAGCCSCWPAGTASSMLRDELSPVSRQHIDLFQGGQLSEAAVESAKARFRDLLERGEVEAVEASLRAGMQYVVQVRALAELGTDDAGRILERQLQRRLTDDQIEQSWYWIDLANGLRSLNRAAEPAAPAALRRGGRRDPAGPFLRRRDGLLPRLPRLPRLRCPRHARRTTVCR